MDHFVIIEGHDDPALSISKSVGHVEKGVSPYQIEDRREVPAEPDARCPTLVFAGRQDDTVPLADVERFAGARAGRELHVMDSGHQLNDVLDPMWERTARFLGALGAL